MITKEELLNIVKKKSRYFVSDNEEVWSLSIKEQLGIDSIMIVAIIAEIEEKYHIFFSIDKLKKLDVKTLNDLWEIIKND